MYMWALFLTYPWPNVLTTVYGAITVIDPMMRRSPKVRPRSIGMHNEMDAREERGTVSCDKCKEMGHNKRRCLRHQLWTILLFDEEITYITSVSIKCVKCLYETVALYLTTHTVILNFLRYSTCIQPYYLHVSSSCVPWHSWPMWIIN